MKRINFLHCMAFLFAVLAIGIVALVAIQPEPLQLAIEWFDGFVGHVDDGLLAAPLVAVRLKRKFNHAGTEHAEGAVIEVESDIADSMESLEIAERSVQGQPTGPTVALTDAQLDRIMGGVTEEEVERERERLSRTQIPAGSKADRLVAAEASVRGDVVQAWKRRSIRYIRANMLFASSDAVAREAAGAIISDLTVETLSMPDQQYEAEHREALNIIESSNLDKAAKRRLRRMVEDYDYALNRLRSVPADKRSAPSPLAPPNKRDMSTLSDTAGGYLVPKPFLAELFVIVETHGVVRRIFRGITMTSNSIDWKDVGTKPTAAWYTELGLVTQSDMSFGAGGMKAGKLAGLTAFSNELDEDTMVALLPVYLDLMGEAIAKEEDKAGIIGDGTSTYGAQRGVLDLTGTGEATVTTLGSGKTSFADFDLDDVLTVLFSISKARKRSGAWLLPETTVKGLLQLKDGIGRHILLDPQNPAAIARLGGYPLVDPEGVDDDVFNSDAVNTVFGAFGDFRRSIFGQRRGLSVTVSREGTITNSSGVVQLNALQQDAQIVMVTERVGIGHPQKDAYALIKTAAS